MIDVAIIEDDHEILRHLGALINAHQDFICQKLYGSVEAGIEPLFADPPDVLLLDISIEGGMDGISGLKAMTARQAPFEVIMFTVHEDDQRVFESLCAGACGYLVKNTPVQMILGAIREANGGGAPMSMQIARMVVQSFYKPPVASLSPREMDVLQELSQGKSYRQVAQRLFVSEDTVRTHIRSIYRKLEVNSKTEAVAKAIKHRLV